MERVIYKAQKPVIDSPAAVSSKTSAPAGTQIGSVLPVPSTAAKPAHPSSRPSASIPKSEAPAAAKDTQLKPKAFKPELPELKAPTPSPAATPAAAPPTPEKREVTAPLPIPAAAKQSSQEATPSPPSPSQSPRQRLNPMAQKPASSAATSNGRSRNSSRAAQCSSGNSLSMPREQQNSDPVVGSWKWCAGCGSTGK